MIHNTIRRTTEKEAVLKIRKKKSGLSLSILLQIHSWPKPHTVYSVLMKVNL